MKHTKKLIPALGMLLLSASMLVTSTFAWFSMNTSVTAENMTVSAKADQVYLQIVNGSDKTAFKDDLQQTQAIANTSASELQPSNVVKSFSGKTFVPFDGGADFKWVSNTSDSVASPDEVQDYTEVNVDGTSYLKTSFMIRLNESAGKDKATAPLTASAVTFGDEYEDVFANCVSVLVVCKEDGAVTGSQLFKQSATNGEFTLKTGNDYLNASETDTEGKPVFGNTEGVLIEVYVFFDGENANCTIANLLAAQEASANSYTVNVAFSCKN